jgi:hypothetical protein
MTTMRRGAALGLVLLGATAAAAQAATVTVVHGIPGFRADVYVNGKKTLEGFEAGTMTNALKLPAGSYRLAIREAGAAPTSKPALTGTLRLEGTTSASVVGHLDARARPKLSVYTNDVSRPAAGRSRLTVRHTAAAPPVDIVVNGRPLFRGIRPPAQRARELAAGTYTVAVSLSGTDTTIWGPEKLTLRPGSTSVVYAIGSQDDGTLDQLVQRFDASGFSPGSVPAGSSGLVAPDASDAVPGSVLAGLAALAAVGAAGSGLVLARGRARSRR